MLMPQPHAVATAARPLVAQRPLRGLEVVLAQLGDSMGPDLIIGKLHGPVSLPLLREACYRVQQTHPGLRAAIRWPDGDRHQRPALQVFEPDPQALDVVQLDEAETEAAGQDWRSTHEEFWQWAAQQQTRHRFDLEHGFLLRVVWATGKSREAGHLIVCSHHAVVDGTSLMRLLNQILSQLGQLQQQLERAGGTPQQAAQRLPAVQPMALPQALFEHLSFGPIEKLLCWVGRWQAISEQKQFLHHPWMPLAQDARRPLSELQISTECVFMRGAESNWEAIHRRCKQQGVTIGGAFSAAVQFAVCRYLREHGMTAPMKGGKVALPLSMDYNMRERIDQGSVPATAIGLCTSIASVGVKVAPDIAFWDLARRIMDSARLQLRFRIPKLFQGVTDTIFGYEDFLRRHDIDHGLAGGAGDGVNISNVGRYPFATEVPPFRLEDVFGFNGACRSGPMFIFWLRQVDGHLCYNAIACSPAATRSMLNQVFAHLLELMEGLVAQQDTLPTLADYAKARPSAAGGLRPGYVG